MRTLMANADKVTVDLTTGIGTLSFPRLFPSTAQEKKDGTKSYEVQIIIPKSQREDILAILRAAKTVGEAKWGDKWKQVRQPLRDGDKEKDELTEDGTTKGEKYPERLGCYFLNARSTKPIAVVGRDRSPITEPSDVYGGCKGKIAVNFYAYSKEGNHGIGAGLNGVQKIADGEPFGGGAPAVESMFDLLADEDIDDVDLDDVGDVDEEPTPPPAKKAAKKAPAKKAAKKAAKPEPEPEVDEDEDDLYDDLDDI
jgi:hypothetical protein